MFSYIGRRVDTRPLLLSCHKFRLRRPSVRFDRKHTEQDLPSRLRSILWTRLQNRTLGLVPYTPFVYSPNNNKGGTMSGMMTAVQWHSYWLLLGAYKLLLIVFLF
ncbi:hypothetical protein GHT06_019792 [Daphnia sinensis]|uniref:Uncharacterized protein n=1 Tax=Daphnia sinensis TaxID=1820382 RepID=A0AAD5PRP9_9CRUS|nr:hypothetical protein GHT06_019792 [Daphnia sinensis]